MRKSARRGPSLCTVLLAPGGYPIAVNKYILIISSYQSSLYRVLLPWDEVADTCFRTAPNVAFRPFLLNASVITWQRTSLVNFVTFQETRITRDRKADRNSMKFTPHLELWIDTQNANHVWKNRKEAQISMLTVLGKRKLWGQSVEVYVTTSVVTDVTYKG